MPALPGFPHLRADVDRSRLDADAQRDRAQRMAVCAAMLDHADQPRIGIPCDGQWRLFDLRDDPTECRDPALPPSGLMQQRLAEVQADDRANGVVMPEPGYDPIRQLLRNNRPVLLKPLWLLPARLLGLRVAAPWRVGKATLHRRRRG